MDDKILNIDYILCIMFDLLQGKSVLLQFFLFDQRDMDRVLLVAGGCFMLLDVF